MTAACMWPLVSVLALLMTGTDCTTKKPLHFSGHACRKGCPYGYMLDPGGCHHCFGPSKSLPKCWSTENQKEATFVTALYDINRENWPYFNRKFEEYLSYFKVVLSMNINLVVYSEPELQSFIHEERKLLMQKTKTYSLRFSDIEYFSYRQRIQDVMESDDFKDDNQMREHPEGFSVEYIIITNNKISFLSDAVRENPFNSSHFFWIDAGYGHGHFSNGTDFIPRRLLEISGKISYIARNDPQLQRNYLPLLHKMPLDPIFSGAFFGGERKAVLEYEKLYRKTFKMLLAENIVDDDQSLALHNYFECPIMFENFMGDWFDAVKLFS